MSAKKGDFMQNLLLAIDIGTSACKIAVFEPNGTVVSDCSKSYHTYYTLPGWVEQDPNEWWQSICEGIRECIEKGGIDPHDIAGIGIDGQSWSCIPIDQSGKVLYNTPIWMDTRAKSICERVNAEIGSENILALSGNPFQPSYTTPKILWFQENKPEVYRDTYKFLQSNSFIVYRLTDVISQDVSQGYGLHVFDIAKRKYSESMCHSLGIDINKLPEIYECHDIVGKVTAKAAALTGLCEGIPVVAGGLDAACGTLGAGVYCLGQTQEQGGQAGGMSICLDLPVSDKALILSPHVVPNLWLLQGGTVGGGSSLRWLAKELGEPEKVLAEQSGESQLKLLDDLASTVPAGSDGVIFLPYLSGERSPIWDPNAKGVYFGLSFDKTRAHFFRSLMEGAAYALKHNLNAAEEVGVTVDVMHAMGGAANSHLWTQIKSDVTGKVIRVPDSDNASTLGAAILAGVGTGVYPSFEDAVKKTIYMKREYVPNMDNHAIYQQYFKIYLEIYEQLKATMEEHAEILNKAE
jgi:xylulokinase